MARVTIYREKERVDERPLARAATTFGRHTDNDVVLDDLSLSRFHARVEQRGAQHFVVDLGSQNGVYVNGERVDGERLLRKGDRIGIGRYLAVFEGDPGDRGARPDAREPGDAMAGPSLLLLHHGEEMERFPLAGQDYVIGRSQRCDIVIGLLGLSRRHARVYEQDGAWLLEDLESQNGTYVNDQRITGAYKLKPGDVLNFFEYSLLFTERSQPASLDHTAPVPPVREEESQQSTLVEQVPGELGEAISGPTASGDDDEGGEAAGFEHGETELEGALSSGSIRVRTRTGTAGETTLDDPGGAEPYSEGGASWPSENDAEMGLTASMELAPAGVLEVRVDNRLVTEVPVDRAALRIGSDARCDVALPPLTSIAGWHLVVIRIGAAVLLTRVGESALPRVEGRPVCQAFLREGDRVSLGRVTLVFRRR